MTEEEQETLRRRIHNINDMVQKHEIRLAEDSVLIRSVTDRVDHAILTMATGEQLRNAEINLGLQFANAKTQLEGAINILTAGLQNVKDDLTPIRKGINWVVTLIVGAVIVALMALVLKGGK